MIAAERRWLLLVILWQDLEPIRVVGTMRRIQETVNGRVILRTRSLGREPNRQALPSSGQHLDRLNRQALPSSGQHLDHLSLLRKTTTDAITFQLRADHNTKDRGDRLAS
jgi:hypothetical protein